METCYRHSDRETNVACSRCGRPICPDCMTPSPVGMRCPECMGDSQQVKRPAFAVDARSAAPATMFLIGLNVAVFLAQLATGGGGGGTTGSVFLNGALCGSAVGSGGICGNVSAGIITDGGEWWRIVSSGFLHGNFLHLGLNMFVLYILGRLLEPAIGTPRTVAIYFVSMLGGSLGALLLSSPEQFTIGASGAVYGLFAATLVIARDRGLNQVVTQLGFWLVLNLVITFTVPTISVGGHLGGLAAGALAALVVLAGERRGSGRKMLGVELATVSGLGIGLAVAAIALAGAGVYTTI